MYKYRDTQKIDITPTTETGSIVSFDNTSEMVEIQNVLADIEAVQDGTPWQSSLMQVPYIFQRTPQLGHDYNSEIVNAIVGGTVAWNQLVQNGDFADTSGWSTSRCSLSVSNNEAIVTMSDSRTAYISRPIQINPSHKYYLAVYLKGESGRTPFIQVGNSSKIIEISGSYSQFSAILTPTSSDTNLYIGCDRPQVGDTLYIKNVMVIDLTALFGSSTIADYLYSLEQTTAGSGIAKLKDWGFDIDSYHAYDAGSLESVNTSEHRTSGFNALNPDADKIKGDYNLAVGAVLPSTSPTASTSGTNPISVVVGNAWDRVTLISDELVANNTYKADYTITGADNSKVRATAYLIDDTYTVIEKIRNIRESSGLKYIDVFTPSKTGLKFALVVSSSSAQTLTIEDLCVHLGEGDYEPYESHSYPLDSDLTLRGIPKLDASNNLYYDGDVYEPSGSVTRGFGIRAYQSGDESLADAITDGTNTVYKLSTPTTETADPFTAIQTVDPYGTEQYIDYGVSQGTRDIAVPVGHQTRYALPVAISGFDEVKVYVSPTEDTEDATVYTVSLASAGTIYGGTLDVIKGELTVTHGYIESYDGETINEPWISSYDPYVSGTTPTEGAQVVYPLTTPTTYVLTQEQIEPLIGPNNIWTDTGDITVTYANNPILLNTLPTEAVSINGRYLEKTIDGYSTLYVKGRESLGIDLSTYSVGTAHGEKIKGSRYPARTLTIGFQLLCANEQEFRFRFNQLNNILSIGEADFIFHDEEDKFFTGTPIMDAAIEPGRNCVTGEWKIYCAYPFKRSVEPIVLTSEDEEGVVISGNTATFTFDYKGVMPARPLLRCAFASAKTDGDYNEDGDCGFVAFLNQDESIIQLGNPEVIDVDELNKNGTLINSEFDALTNWTPSGITVGNISDPYWAGGKGQTMAFAKGIGTLSRSTSGAVGFEFDIVHRLCVSAAAQTGSFKVSMKNGNDTVVGFIIEKTGSGTTGTVKYIVNNKVVGTDNIDLSYYNTSFGYCRRDPVYVQEAYQVWEEYQYFYYVKKKVKGKKKKVKVWATAGNWVTHTRTVQRGWRYTQSNLNSGISRDGGVVTFSIGNLADRTFKDSDIDNTACYDVIFETTGSFHTNAVRSCAFIRKAGVPFAEIPNVFTAGDVVQADCSDATVYLYRAGSTEGHLEPQYGALGNDWEDFEVKVGTNIIRAAWSDWVDEEYRPKIEIAFNEVFI